MSEGELTIDAYFYFKTFLALLLMVFLPLGNTPLKQILFDEFTISKTLTFEI